MVGDQIESFLRTAIKVGDAVAIEIDVVPWWPFHLPAAGAFGLAEMFRHGSALQDFERLAI